MLLAPRQLAQVAPLPGGLPPMHLLDRQGGQYHELRPGRTTIGSSPKCTLRLERPGVQPLHCLIVHGPEGISVRRWAPDAQLNGVPFDDASIVAGDCLAIGGVEFELVKDTVDSADARQDAAAETFLDATDASCSRLMDAVQESVDAITEMETVSDREPAGVEASAEVDVAAEIDETLDVAEAVDMVGTNEVVETADVGEMAMAVDVVEVVDRANLIDALQLGGSSEVGETTEGYVADCEAMPTAAAQSVSADKAADEAAEFVFRELRAACAVARGRTRRMLGALRSEREQNRELLERFTDIGRQLAQLKQQPPASELAGDVVASEFAKWQTQWVELRQQFAVWEAKLVEHTQRMAELQQDLIEVRDHRSADVFPAVPAASKSSDTTVVIPVPDAEDFAAKLDESTIDSIMSQDTWSESAAATEPEIEPFVEPVADVRKSPWLEADVPRVEESRAALEDPTSMDDSAAASESPAEPWAAIADESQVSDVAADELHVAPDEMPSEWPQAESVASSAPDNEHAPVAGEADLWAVPAAASEWSTKKSDAEPAAESEMRKSLWIVPSKPGAGDSNEFDTGGEASAIEVEAPAWASGPTVEPAAGEDEVSPFAEFSIWKQGTSLESAGVSEDGRNETAASEPETPLTARWEAESAGDFAVAEISQPTIDSQAANTAQVSEVEAATPEPLAAIATPEPVSPRRSQPASFIDRYSHLFDEDAASEPAATPPVQRTVAEDRNDHSLAFRGGQTIGNSERLEDEESIEQYMAKLMQRMRGESPTVEPSPPTTSRRPSRPVGNMMPSVGNAASAVSNDASNRVEDGTHAPTVGEGDSSAVAVVDWEAIARRAATTAPKADMGALRALANETARRAIGRHELKKHRRDAMTKVIVSSLAGMTSLWLMLDSPSWLDVQFLTACVSLVAAAYWAGGTFKELLESMRAAAYDGPEKPQSDVGSALPPALPIDVE